LAITVQYRSSREEIWSWYWRAWRSGLWRVHATWLACVSLAILVLRSSQGMPDFRDFVFAILAGAAWIALLPLYPMLRFKTEVRTLTIDETGVSTIIGKRSGFRAWSEIESVQSEQGTIVITGRNRNAFIVPRRAFDTDREQKKFLSYAQQAFRSSRPGAI
jgi:YcxB-like protein